MSAVVGIAIMIPLIPILLPLLAVYGIVRLARGRLLVWRFRRTWGAKGRVALLVYSDSPNWKTYIETNILPLVEDRVVALNWSKRAQWRRGKPLEVRLFEHWSGEKEYSPMVILVPPKGKVKTIRLFQAFKDLKHGKAELLHDLEKRLLAEIHAA
jgi:hypothetical protein